MLCLIRKNLEIALRHFYKYLHIGCWKREGKGVNRAKYTLVLYRHHDFDHVLKKSRSELFVIMIKIGKSRYNVCVRAIVKYNSGLKQTT